jgi:hypothetical protein
VKKQSFTSADIIKLGAMECAASCILTALNIAGMNHRYFLLSYWNLTYNSKIIMSGKHMIRNDLEYAYGIKIEYRLGNEYDLIAMLRHNNMILLSCQASRLRFFSKNMLDLDTTGFQHYILLYGYRSETGNFLVIDPIADFIGEMAPAEIWESSVKENELMYCALLFPEVLKQPAISDIFIRESSANVKFYTGDKAISQFIQDVKECTRLRSEERNIWIDQNNITITSIVKTRALVWQCFCELNVMSGEDIRAGNELLKGVVKLWTTVNFLLIKLKKSFNNEAAVTSIEQKLVLLRNKERECLEFIMEKGRELSAI